MDENLPKRKDIRNLDQDERDTLIRAFDGIQKLDPKNPNSFFHIAGYHGEPFRGAGWGNSSWWGGYCNHGNVLFPTWHRAYLYCLEKALQSVEDCAGVTIPYWNEIDDLTLTQGLPDIFLLKDYTFQDGRTSIDGKTTIPNPLYSYKFQAAISDNLSPFPDADYGKPQNYETVRYPFSGLVGPDNIDTTRAHNRVMNDLGTSKTNQYLNDNIRTWLSYQTFKNDEGKVVHAGLKEQYLKSLLAENYTIFSNETSARQWNEDGFDTDRFEAVVPIELPHDGMHLAIGGYEVPGTSFDVDTVPGANGDMGENDTAAFDPIFYFHHCFIDLMFWKWQLDHGGTQKLDIIPRYPGTNSVDSQGPTPGVAGGSWLTMDSSLEPFVKEVVLPPVKERVLPPVRQSVPMTSKDVVDIKKLGYTYEMPVFPKLTTTEPSPHLRVSGVNRASISGSFAISTWAFKSNSEPLQLVGLEPVLSRWHVSGCANCNNHLEVKAFVPLTGWSHAEAEKTSFEAKVHTRDNRQGVKTPGGRMPHLRLGAVGVKSLPQR